MKKDIIHCPGTGPGTVQMEQKFIENFIPCGITQNDLKLIFLLSVNGPLSNDVKIYLGAFIH